MMTEQSGIFMHGISLPDAFSCGQLFAFSGLSGENSRSHDWCGVLTDNPGEIRFTGGQESSCPVLLRFTESSPAYDVVVPDLIAADDRSILVTFADAQTVVGRSDMPPAIRPESGKYTPGDRTICYGEYAYALAVQQSDGEIRFAFCRRTDAATAEADAHNALSADIRALAAQIHDWYLTCPICPDPQYEKLWYKCLSVNRVNVYSPQDGLTRSSTVPDRLTHRAIQTWDSCFHAVAMTRYAPALAEEAVLAILECQRADGFIPHEIKTKSKTSDCTYPPVLCTTIWSLFEATGNYELLRRTAEPLRRNLEWLLQNRRSPNGLMTWRIQRDGARSICVESGMDDSPRFDTAEQLEAVDFSVLTAYELLFLHRIYMTIGDHMSALHMEEMHREMVDRINRRLWDEQTHCYYDRTRVGAFRRILTPASFLPLFAGMCDPRQAQLLTSHLKPLLDCPFPIPSAADEQGGWFTRSAWRGGVWLHYNFFIYIGLQRYGFGKLASILRQKTIEGVEKLFLETGKLYECYDPLGGDPLHSESPDTLPDAPEYARAVTDSNRTASFIQLFLFS